MSVRSLLLTAVAATSLTLLANCGTVGAMTGNLDRYHATLVPGEEVPPNNSTGSGDAEVSYNHATSTLSYKVTYRGLTGPATAAHIHGPAGPGQNAGVVVPFPNATSSPISGEFKLTPEQANQLKSGQYYVNVHTARNPGGEIRGQLRPR